MKGPFSFLVAAFSAGFIVIGYFFPIPALAALRATVLQWAVILAGFALLVGVINLINVHITQFKRGQKGRFYNLVLILSFLVTLVVVGIFTPTHPASIWIFNNIQFPLEASLFAILSVILLYAGVRLLRRRLNAFSVIFLISAVLFLLGSAPLYFFGQIDLLNDARDFIVQVVSVGGARGILIGVALGTLATGVRILIGSDRPYNG
jgi:hypothetical protein